MSVGHVSILQKTLSMIYDPAVRKSELAFKLDQFPSDSGVLVNLWGGRYEVMNQIQR